MTQKPAPTVTDPTATLAGHIFRLRYRATRVRRVNGTIYNALLNVVDRLLKERHHIPRIARDEGTTAAHTAQLLVENIWRFHGLPLTIISNQRPQFVSIV